jgi:hypothetical protein
MEVLEDGTIYLAECQKMLGSECGSAERVRKHRLMLKEQEMLHCNDNVTNGNTQVTKSNIDIDIDKEKDIDNMYVNNIKNENENNNLSHTYIHTHERTEEERQAYKSRWSEFFKYCFTGKYVDASNFVLDTILNTKDYFNEYEELKFNSKRYNKEDFETILDKIDDDKFRHITQSVALDSDNIKDKAGYILGCLIKASEI